MSTLSKIITKGVKKTFKIFSEETDLDKVYKKELGKDYKVKLKEFNDNISQAQAKQERGRFGGDVDVEKINRDAAKDLRDGKITTEEFKIINSKVLPMKLRDLIEEGVPKAPSNAEILKGLNKNESAGHKLKEYGVVGLTKTQKLKDYLKVNKKVGARLDIPTYRNKGIYLVTLHDGPTQAAKTLAHARSTILRNVEFFTDPDVGLNIAIGSERGGQGKSTIAKMYGEYIPHKTEDAEEYAKQAILKNPNDWIQIGMNPDRASYFYDKADGNPVLFAEVIIQLGEFVLAKNAKKTTFDDPRFTFYGASKKGKNFLEGAMSPIKIKDNVVKGTRTFNKGGNVKDQTQKLLQEGGLNEEGGTVDPVSGNDVPVGSTQEEVRDDIPAQLSEGEFVFPADVVRFIGLNNLMKLRQEAKEGLGKMDRMGQMGNSEEAVEDDTGEFDTDIDSIIEEVETEMAAQKSPKNTVEEYI